MSWIQKWGEGTWSYWQRIRSCSTRRFYCNSVFLLRFGVEIRRKIIRTQIIKINIIATPNLNQILKSSSLFTFSCCLCNPITGRWQVPDTSWLSRNNRLFELTSTPVTGSYKQITDNHLNSSLIFATHLQGLATNDRYSRCWAKL